MLLVLLLLVSVTQVFILVNTGKEMQTTAMILTSHGPLTLAQRMRLHSLGVISSSIGTVTTIQVPVQAVEQTLGLEFVSGVYSPRVFRPALDASAHEIGATSVWQNVTGAGGKLVDGSGVLIGIIDTGVDLSHPDLRFRNGTSKVLYLWDQTTSGKPPRGFTYGVECASNETNSGRCPEKDTYGHGTHVASIAVSSGLATGMYRGIAPGASLLVVKSGRPVCEGANWTFDENAIIDGLAYVANKARELRMRLVVNLSLGGNIGGHDDTSPLEMALDELNAQGIIVTVSAGNDAGNRGHASGLLAGSSETSINWQINDHTRSAMVDLWYPTDRTISAALVTPSGEEVQGPTPGEGVRTSEGLVTILEGKTSKARRWALSVERQDELSSSAWNMIIRLTDGGHPLRWDAYLDGDGCSYPAATFSNGEGYTVNQTGSVSVPATASGVITVGAYITKNAWFNKLGSIVTLPDYHVGEIARFSSRGPTRDGRVKPDISGPGALIIAARSVDVPSGDSDPDDYHRVLAGTSMAAPHVAGVVALMLQYNPLLTTDEIRSIIVEGAYLDQFTGFIDASRGSNDWGWGKTDARTATNQFRVSMILVSLPSDFHVSLTVDGELRELLQGGQLLTMRFFRGGVHAIQVAEQTFTANKTRYIVSEDRAVYSTNGVFAPNVQVQYLLALESPLGQTQGQGWYHAGSYANFTVDPVVVSGGLGQLIGVGYVLDHWVDERGNKISSGSLMMDLPHSLKAMWRAQLIDGRPILVLTALLAAFIITLRYRSRKPAMSSRSALDEH